MPDLASFHEPISDFLSVSCNDTSDYHLSEARIKQFEDDGYLAGIKILSESQVDRLRDELEEFFKPEHDGKEYWYEYHSNESSDPNRTLFHALGAWRIGVSFHDILWHPAFVTVAEQLLGGDVRFWHDQLFCKPAHHGGVVAWHQDYSYWTRTKPLAHLTCWIALDDATADNGCVLYVPGSHRWDLLPITGLAGDMEAIQEVLTPAQFEALQKPVAAEVKKGEATFHHGLTIHGSRENNTDRPRRATVINAFRDGVLSAANEPLLTGVSAIAADEKMEGEFFPLLSKPRESRD
jgi:ectoine hydroxylase-related dioxygenase (phytanoyl-CoA dioxygenase family)